MGSCEEVVGHHDPEDRAMSLRLPGFRAAALGGVALFGALLLRGAPGLRQVAVVTIPIGQGQSIDALVMYLILCVSFLVPVLLVRWARYLLVAEVVSIITWAFAGSSRVPWWLFQNRTLARLDSPSATTVFYACLMILCALGYQLVVNLETYVDAAEKRGLELATVRPDLRRIATVYAAFALATTIAGALLVPFFEFAIARADRAPSLSGTVWGVWTLLLMVALFGGFFLVLGRGTTRAKARVAEAETWTKPDAAR
jgi:hypothetical protein